MTLQQSIRDMSATKDMSGQWLAFMGLQPSRDGPPIAANLVDYSRVPADEAWVYRCVTIKMAAAQSVPLRVEVLLDEDDWVDANVTDNQAAKDVQWLLDDANPVNMSGNDLKAWVQAGRDVWGESYVQKVRGKLGGAPQELYYLRAPDITPNLGRVWIDSYLYKPTWKPTEQASGTTIPAADIIPFRRINLQNPTRGLSPLSAIRNEVAVLKQATLGEATLLANDSIPPGAWVAPRGEEISTQDVNLIRRALRALRGPAGKGKTPVLPGDLKWQPLSMAPKDAEWVHSRKLSRMDVCAAFGVPLVMAGDDERTTVYHNMRDAERIFWRMCMIPELDDVADTWNSWLLPDFDPGRRQRPAHPTIRVRYRYDAIEALQDPLATQKATGLNEVKLGVRLIDEYRSEFGTGGGDPLPWGQERPVVGGPDVQGPTPEVDGDMVPNNPPDADVSDTVREFRGLYRQPAVREWLANPSSDLDTKAMFGHAVPDAQKSLLKIGLRRKYSPPQLADGVPAENYPGLRGA